MRDIVISLGRAENFADIARTVEQSWESFAKFLTRDPPETDDKTSVGWYCPAEFAHGKRTGKDLVERHCLTFDYDDIDSHCFAAILNGYKGYAHAVYTTASHTKEAPRLRVVFPLSRPCNTEEFGCVTRTVANWVGIEMLARESDKPAQMMFRPSKKPGAEFWSEIFPGEWIDVNRILESYDDWTDKSSWPTRRTGDSPNTGEVLTPPDQKTGIVGDFCRVFTVPDAIEKFSLPYEAGSNDLRWTYTSGSRPDGLRIYDNGLKGHAEDNTDPAHGQNNAFDLVRIHQFPDLIKQEKDLELTITELPSYKAMCEFARALPELQDKFDDLGPLEDKEKVKTNRFKFWSHEELKLLPRPEWIIKGVIPKAELAVIFGPPGSGKSFLAYDMACSILRGTVWGDAEAKVKKGRVTYVYAEGATGAWQRGEAYCLNNGAGELPTVIRDAPNMFDRTDSNFLIRRIREQGGADLVIIDTLTAASPGADENYGKDMTKILDHCRRVYKFTGATVLLIHHSGKDTSKGARGWSGLKGRVDAEIELLRNGDFRTAVITKLKDGADGTRHTFKLKTVVLGMDEDGDEITSCVVEHIAPAPEENKRQEPRGEFGKTALRTAKVLMCDGSAISVDQLVSETVKKMPRTETGKNDSRRQQTVRAVRKLVVDGHLFLHGEDMVSITTAVQDEENWDDE